jgi:hypothetical protein
MRIAHGFRSALTLALAAAALHAAPATAQESLFPRGAFSVGAQGGYALFSMGQINDQIRIINTINGTDFEELDSGWDFAGDVRYAVTDVYFVGVEAGTLRGETNSDSLDRSFEASAVPVVLIGGGGVTNAESGIAFRIIGGLGALLNGTFEQAGTGEVSGSAFLFQLGGEFEYRPSRAFGATVQAMVRQSKVSKPDGAPYDLDFSGGSARLGLRLYFGG